MTTDVKDQGPEAPKTENVVTRVTSLPLVSSAYDLCAYLYRYAKERHPCVNSAFNIAELVANVVVGSALGGAQPLLGHLEPQIAAVNEYACKKLDKMEETLPILQQPTYQIFEDGVTLTKSVVTSTVTTARDAACGAKEIVTDKVTKAVSLTKDIVQDSVTLTRSVVASTVKTAVDAAAEAKELVTHRVSDVVNLTKETVQDSVNLTKSVVASTGLGMKRCGDAQDGQEMTNFVKQMLASGVNAVLGKTEEMVEHYLPMTDEELAKLATEVKGFSEASVEDQKRLQSYFVRLGSLSNKVRQRAYLHSVKRLHLFKENTQNALFQLQLVMNLVEYLKQGPGRRFQEAHQRLQQLLTEWTQQGEDQAAENAEPEVEPRTLAMLRAITQDLGPGYLRLVATLEGLPNNIRERLDHAVSGIRQLHAAFSSAATFQDLSASVLAQSRERISKAYKALDLLVDYIVQNTPLNWVVGPFRPVTAADAAAEVAMKETEAAMKETEALSTSGVKPAKKLRKEAADGGEVVAEQSGAPKERATAVKKMRPLPKSPEQKVVVERKVVVEQKVHGATPMLVEEALLDMLKKSQGDGAQKPPQ